MCGLLVIGPSRKNRLTPTSDEQSPGGMASRGAVSNQSSGLLARAPALVRTSHGGGVAGRFEEPVLRRGRRVQVCSQRSTRTIEAAI